MMPRDTKTIILTQNNLKTPLEQESQEQSGRGHSHTGRKKNWVLWEGKSKVWGQR